MSNESYTPVSPEEATEQIGVAVHTGLRKATDSKEAIEAHSAIAAVPPEDWSSALNFAVWGLEQMGFVLCRKNTAPDGEGEGEADG